MHVTLEIYFLILHETLGYTKRVAQTASMKRNCVAEHENTLILH